MNQMSLLDTEPIKLNVRNRTLATLMGRWLDALAREQALPAKDREGRIDAATVAFGIEREIIAELASLEGKIPAVIIYRNEWYIVSRSVLLKAEFINLEESA